MTAEHMASCQNKKPCAPEQQKQDSPHRDRDSVTRKTELANESYNWKEISACSSCAFSQKFY